MTTSMDALIMKTPKINWPNKKKTAVLLADIGLTQYRSEVAIRRAVKAAGPMSTKGLKRIQKIIDKDKSDWKKLWNEDKMLKCWFGKVSQANHVKDVYRRLKKVEDRVNNKMLTIRVREGDANASNGGGFISPKTFKVYPAWFSKSVDEGAAIIIHELMHEWFTDQKIGGKTVYGIPLAKKLAREKPSKARKSAENYEQYCLAL